ncbi:MAG: TIGR02679 family protein [Streptosporangiaceae bacterium]|nr:TIGR02679 family protein [Streptosporangiaceae bacterium]
MPNPFEAPEYRRLLRAARRSLERTGGDLDGSVSVSSPDDAERKAIIGVTGQYRPAGTARLTVRLAELDAAVREAAGRGLPELLAELGGPLRDRPAELASHVAERETTIRSLEKSLLFAEFEWFREWIGAVARDGTLTKLVNSGEQWRIAQAVRVLEFLAARDGVPVLLPELAAAVTGDTKALNPGTVLSTLVLRALSLRSLELGAGGPARFDTAQARRELWDVSDVVVDDLASRVLVLNLPASGDGLGEWLTGAACRGVPFYVTLQQLLAMPVRIGEAAVYVCENPAVLRRAASDLGACSAPLLCAEGRPSTAFHQLASAVVAGGGGLLYHGDFDWPGVAIAASVMARHGARPWRFGAADYTAGLRDDSMLLGGSPQSTPWDPSLGAVMTSAGRVVYEESVAGPLIDDLCTGGEA